MKNVAITLSVCFILTGCAPQKSFAWYNPNPRHHDFDKERYECLREANETAPTEAANGRDMFGDPYSYDMNLESRDSLMQACMKTKGWELRQVDRQGKIIQ